MGFKGLFLKVCYLLKLQGLNMGLRKVPIICEGKNRITTTQTQRTQGCKIIAGKSKHIFNTSSQLPSSTGRSNRIIFHLSNK